GEGLELDLALGLEALDRRDQPQEAVGDEVGLLHVGGQPARHTARDVLDERGIGEHESLAGLLVAFVLIALPEVPELYGLEICLHTSPGSRTRVRARVRLLEAFRLYPSVCLGRA